MSSTHDISYFKTFHNSSSIYNNNNDNSDNNNKCRYSCNINSCSISSSYNSRNQVLPVTKATTLHRNRSTPQRDAEMPTPASLYPPQPSKTNARFLLFLSVPTTMLFPSTTVPPQRRPGQR